MDYKQLINNLANASRWRTAELEDLPQDTGLWPAPRVVMEIAPGIRYESQDRVLVAMVRDHIFEQENRKLGHLLFKMSLKDEKSRQSQALKIFVNDVPGFIQILKYSIRQGHLKKAIWQEISKLQAEIDQRQDRIHDLKKSVYPKLKLRTNE